MKDLETLDAAFLIDTFLLLLIGIGPKIALVPFLDATVGRQHARGQQAVGSGTQRARAWADWTTAGSGTRLARTNSLG